jgi:RHS repeat-associated protein
LLQLFFKKIWHGSPTIFHYDFDGKLIAESHPDGTITKEYLSLGSSRLATVDTATNTMYYFLNDHLGTPLMMTDSTGKVVWQARYKPFGEAHVHPRATITNNFRFPGQYYDEETGLHYNYFRYYDPETGRYIRPDPAGLAGGTNLFLYTNNNPICLTDPDGLRVFYWGFGASAGAGRKEGDTVNYLSTSGIIYQGSRRAGGTEKGVAGSLGGGRIIGATAGAGLIFGYNRGDVEDLSGRSTAAGITVFFISLELTFDENNSWTGFNFGLLKSMGFGFYGVETITYRLPTHAYDYEICK